MSADPELTVYRFEGGPSEGPIHWSMAYALAKGKSPSVCVNPKGVGWHRYVRTENAGVFTWDGLCADDHHLLEECERE